MNAVNGKESDSSDNSISPFVGAKKSVDDLGRYFDNLFSTELPFIGPNTVWEFDINPKFGDIVEDPYIRMPVEATYGFSDSMEASVGYIPYLSNPAKSPSEYSDGYLTLGFKKRFAHLFGEKWDFAVGATARKPMDDIPDDYVRANHTIIRPFAVISKRLGDTERWTAYLNANYDLVGDYVHRDEEHVAQPDSLFSLQPGIIFKPGGEWRYSLELEFATTRFDGDEDDQWIIEPGVTWFPSEERRQAWFIPGDYSVGLTLGIGLDQLNENEDRSDMRIGIRLRWRLRAK